MTRMGRITVFGTGSGQIWARCCACQRAKPLFVNPQVSADRLVELIHAFAKDHAKCAALKKQRAEALKPEPIRDLSKRMVGIGNSFPSAKAWMQNEIRKQVLSKRLKEARG